ncbi:MAG: hypothetical protein ACYYK0_02935 [Candidatus Eutrophobiaceae bacterium]
MKFVSINGAVGVFFLPYAASRSASKKAPVAGGDWFNGSAALCQIAIPMKRAVRDLGRQIIPGAMRLLVPMHVKK